MISLKKKQRKTQKIQKRNTFYLFFRCPAINVCVSVVLRWEMSDIKRCPPIAVQLYLLNLLQITETLQAEGGRTNKHTKNKVNYQIRI